MKSPWVCWSLACILSTIWAATLIGRDSVAVVKALSGGVGNLTAAGNGLYFFSNDAVNGSQLWKSDGTTEGTGPTRIVPNGNIGFEWATTGPFQTGVVFMASGATPHGRELWKSDGTEAGTIFLKFFYYGISSVSNPVAFANTGTYALFNGKDSVTGQELWTTDGTESGTVLVKDIQSGPASSGPMELTVIGETVFFTATQAASGRELWRSDGSEQGTFIVKDIVPGPTGSYPSYLVAAGKTLFFAASDSLHGRELWKSDGTPEGTVIVKDILPGRGNGLGITVDLSQKPLTFVNGIVYFPATDGVHGYELWRSDGTEEGTYMLKDICPGAGSSQDSTVYKWLKPSCASIGGTLFFVANDSSHGTELWKTDGTESGTSLVKDIFPGAAPNFPPGSIGNYPRSLTATSRMLYFVGNDSIHGAELWESNGTPEGTEMVADLNPGPIGSLPGGLTVFRDSLFFSGPDGLCRVVSVETSVDPLVQPAPRTITLNQNYPNPFNPGTTIEYELPQASEVRLSVFDILGREVSVLEYGLKVAGVHKVRFEGSVLSSGTYFYRLQARPLWVGQAYPMPPASGEAGNFTQTRRLLLLK